MIKNNSLASLNSVLSFSSVESQDIPDNNPETDNDEINAFHKYKKIGTLTDLVDVKESICTKHYDEEGNKYYNEYKFISYIGSGAFSKIELVEKDGVKYAMKIIDKEFLKSQKDIEYDENGEVDLEACRRVEFKFRMRDPGILAGTGIIEELTQVLEESGLEVSVDENTGDIRLNSTIMFDTSSAEVKEEGQEFIQKFLPVYLDVLMKPEYEEYIGVIIIEGYTDNKGAYTAQQTISQWKSVCDAEEQWIFPFQETADVMFNSALNIEFAVLRTHAEVILSSVPRNCPEYAEAHRLLKFIHYFIPVSDKEIPPTSIMREFLGGSSFKY